jgi:hypothetical protein
VYVEEEEPEDKGLMNSNNKSRRKVDQLEEEKYHLINELEARRSRTPNRMTHNNNVVDYREAIRELSAKNQQLKKEIERARSRTPEMPPIDQSRLRRENLMKEIGRLQRANQNLQTNMSRN